LRASIDWLGPKRRPKIDHRSSRTSESFLSGDDLLRLAPQQKRAGEQKPAQHNEHCEKRSLAVSERAPAKAEIKYCDQERHKCRSSDALDWAAPQVPLPPDRIDHIAAATAVASTDRSTSQWK